MDGDWQNQSFMQKVQSGYENAWKTFVKPSRFRYGVEALEPRVFVWSEQNILKREDFVIKNKRGLDMVYSVFIPQLLKADEKRTCLIYLHSQSGCRIEGLFLREFCAKNNIYLCLFDFSACGLSDGKYVSLGHYEKYDLSLVDLDYIDSE
jgi:hypothetical protein